jgi:hypothetical protein
MKRKAVDEGGKRVPAAPRTRRPLRSGTVNTFTFVAGLITAGIGLLGVLTRPGAAFDLALIPAGLVVAAAGLVLRRRNPRA